MSTVLRFLLRLVLLVTGLVFAAGLALLLLLLLTLAGLRAGWARLTGQPVTPFVFRVDPRAGFGRVYRASRQPASAGDAAQGDASSAAPAPRGTGMLRRPADVSDVEPRQPAS